MFVCFNLHQLSHIVQFVRKAFVSCCSHVGSVHFDVNGMDGFAGSWAIQHVFSAPRQPN